MNLEFRCLEINEESKTAMIINGMLAEPPFTAANEEAALEMLKKDGWRKHADIGAEGNSWRITIARPNRVLKK